MGVPNGERAIVDESKLAGYCLSSTHLLGRHKARAFRAALGLTAADAPVLRQELLHQALHGTAVFEREDAYGTRYAVEFQMVHKTRKATVRSLWMIRRGEELPRLVTCYVR